MTLMRKSVYLLDAYGKQIEVEQRRETTTTLGGSHAVLSFKTPRGYLTPKRIIHIDDIEPCYTDTFVMINPSHPLVEAPAIEDLPYACELNLREATRAVALGGIRLSSWIAWDNPLEVRQDRGWFKVLKRPGSLLEALKATGVMVEVPGTLHHPHKPNFELVASYKTRQRVPILQVTLWHDAGEWVAELDIDLKKGIGHWKEVVRNHLTMGKTHPYLVNQLLSWYWGVVPFKLKVSSAKPG